MSSTVSDPNEHYQRKENQKVSWMSKVKSDPKKFARKSNVIDISTINILNTYIQYFGYFWAWTFTCAITTCYILLK